VAKGRAKQELSGLDAVLAPRGDMVSDVVQRDRERAGRGEVRDDEDKHYDNMTSPMTNMQTSEQAGGQTDIQARPMSAMQAGVSEDARASSLVSPPEPVDARPAPAPHGPEAQAHKPRTRPARASLVERRRAQAALAAAGRTMTVTLRIPQPMNDWLDDYVHQSWPERVRKQELVIEALRMLMVRRGQAGEEVLPTELLDD